MSAQDIYLYGLVSRGHVNGGINIFPPFDRLRRMEVINYEAGWKATLGRRSVQHAIHVYYETFDDYQANFCRDRRGSQHSDQPQRRDGEHGLGNRVERPGARSAPSRWTSAWRIWRASSARSATSSIRSAPRRSNGWHSGYVVNLSGAKVPFSPEFTGNIGLAYDIKLGKLHADAPRGFLTSTRRRLRLWDTPMVTLRSRDLINAQICARTRLGQMVGRAVGHQHHG